MKKSLTIIGVIVFLCAVSFAATFENTEVGLSLWVPDDWETTNEQGMLTADAPDGDAFIILEALENADDLETALTVYEEILDTYFQNYVAEGEPSQIELNGLVIEGLHGTGTMDGENWEIDVMLIYTGESVCICISAVADSAANVYDKTFEDIAASLHKI